MGRQRGWVSAKTAIEDEQLNLQLGPNLSVNCDFDGTISTSDVTDLILSRLAEPAWLEIEAEWLRGEIGSLECMARQVPLIRGGWAAVDEVLQEVTIEPSFSTFVEWCESQEIPVTVVSEGLDRVISSILARHGLGHLRLIANQLVEDRFGRFSLSFPYRPKNAGCRSGVCKCQSLSTVVGTSVVIGDGKSDFCWGERADLLFAKSKLLVHCRESNIPCYGFEDFLEIRTTLESLAIEGMRTDSPRSQTLARPLGPVPTTV